jgi:hypothetical protein
MLSMTPLSQSRVLLVPEARAAAATGPQAAKIRRYRLARLRLLERRDADPGRYPHLARSYD